MKFELDEQEQTKFNEWNKKHLEERHEGVPPYTGAIGGRVSFTITHTGLGTIVSASCGVCERMDLRDRVVNALFDSSEHKDGTPECHQIVLTDFSEW